MQEAAALTAGLQLAYTAGRLGWHGGHSVTLLPDSQAKVPRDQAPGTSYVQPQATSSGVHHSTMVEHWSHRVKYRSASGVCRLTPSGSSYSARLWGPPSSGLEMKSGHTSRVSLCASLTTHAARQRRDKRSMWTPVRRVGRGCVYEQGRS